MHLSLHLLVGFLFLCEWVSDFVELEFLFGFLESVIF